MADPTPPSTTPASGSGDRLSAAEVLTPQTAAAALNGREYRDEVTRDMAARLKAAGLVAVYGASDDLVEFDGAIRDELGCYGSADVYLTAEGLLEDCGDGCVYFRRAKAAAARIRVQWNDNPGSLCWTYETTIPHSTFEIMEDGEAYCRGIVFRLADAQSAGGAA